VDVEGRMGKRVVANQQGYRRGESVGYDVGTVVVVEGDEGVSEGEVMRTGAKKISRLRAHKCIVL
jgi:hypothetical protein